MEKIQYQLDLNTYPSEFFFYSEDYEIISALRDDLHDDFGFLVNLSAPDRRHPKWRLRAFYNLSVDDIKKIIKFCESIAEKNHEIEFDGWESHCSEEIMEQITGKLQPRDFDLKS